MPQHTKQVKRLIISVLLAVIFAFAAHPVYMNKHSFESMHKTAKNKTAVVKICQEDNLLTVKCNHKDVTLLQNSVKGKTCTTVEMPIASEWQAYQMEIVAPKDSRAKIIFEAPDKSFHRTHYTVWADFKNIGVNSRKLTEETKHVSHKHPYIQMINLKENTPYKLTMEIKKPRFHFKDLSRDYSLSYLVLLTVSILSFLLAYKIVGYLALFKLNEKSSGADIVFLSIFFLSLFIPMSHISKEETSQNENRVLATYPSLLTENGLNIKFGKKFENWFNDRFFGRRFFLSAEEKLKGLIEPQRGNKKVLVGKDGWLFYKGGDGLNNFANKSDLSTRQLQKGLKYLTDINAWATAHNKKFYYLLIPDKNRVYGEYVQYIQKVRPDSYSIDNQWLNYIRENSSVNVTYLYDTLVQNKSKGTLYWKEDTHWNYFGAYIGFEELIKTLAKDYDISPYVVTSWQDEVNPSKDLSRMYPYGYKDKTVKYKEPVMTNRASICTTNKEEGVGVVLCRNPKKHLKAFILHDSFSDCLMSYYAETFKEVKLVRRYDITAENLTDIAAHYDLIILENVARSIPKILNKTFPKD